MRASRLRTIFVLSVAILFAMPARAQVTARGEFHAQASSSSDASSWRDESTIGATLRLDRPRWWMSSTGAVRSAEEGWRPGGSLSATILSPVLGSVQLSASGALARASRTGSVYDAATIDGRASVKFARGGAWLGLSARRVDQAHSSDAETWPVLGAWRELGSAVLSFGLSPRSARLPAGFVSGPDSIGGDTLGPGPDSTRASAERSWSDAEARLVWAHGRWAVDATLGGRLASVDRERAMWGQLQGLYTLTPRLALIAAAGSAPADPVFGWNRHAFATLGVRVLGAPEPRAELPAEIRTRPADFRVLAVHGEERLVRVRVPFARTVELSADFTAWEPIALTRASADWWEAPVAIAPGTYHVNIRVNGDAWTAPPGTPTVEDEFNGTVGLVVVQ